MASSFISPTSSTSSSSTSSLPAAAPVPVANPTTSSRPIRTPSMSTMPHFNPDMKMDNSLLLTDKSEEKTRNLREIFRQSSSKISKCWDGWNSSLPAETQSKHLNDFLSAFVGAVHNAGCLPYIEQSSKWEQIHTAASQRNLPISEDEFQAILANIDIYKAVSTDPNKTRTEKSEAATKLRQEERKMAKEQMSRRFHSAAQTKLSEFLSIKETLLALLMTYLPALGGSARDLLPNDAPPERAIKQLKSWKAKDNPLVHPLPTLHATEDDLIGILVDQHPIACVSLPWSKFMVFETYLQRVVAHFDMVHPQDLSSKKASLLSRDNKRYNYREETHTFMTWWSWVSQQIHSLNNSPLEFTETEKLLFLVNNTGHIPWLSSLTARYMKVSPSATVNFSDIKTEYEELDVAHWSFHPKPATTVSTAITEAKSEPNVNFTGQNSQKGGQKRSSKHPGQRKLRQEEKMTNKGGQGKPQGKYPKCPVCGKQNHPVERCFTLRDLKNQSNQNKRKDNSESPDHRPKSKKTNKGDRQVNFDTNITYVAKEPALAQVSSTSSRPRTANEAVSKVTSAIPANSDQILLDTGATYTAMGKPVQGVNNIRRADWTMTFGNGQKAPIEQLGSIGSLNEVALCKSMHVSVASISQIANDLDCVTVFTNAKAYVLKPGAIINLKKKDVMLTADQEKGLYMAKTVKFVDAIVANSGEGLSDDE